VILRVFVVDFKTSCASKARSGGKANIMARLVKPQSTGVAKRCQISAVVC
jgi:hypothetical protein